MEAVGTHGHSGLLRGGLSAARGQASTLTRPRASGLGKVALDPG